VSLPFLGFPDECYRPALAAHLGPARAALIPGADSTLFFSPLFAILQRTSTPAMGCGEIRKQILVLMAEESGVA
jgi:hypothetical protein